MRNKIILITVILMVLSISIFHINDDNLFKIDNILYAVSVDGKDVYTLPLKGDYIVDINCQSATGKWNYDTWQVELEDIEGNVTCDIDFTSQIYENLNAHVISLVGIAQGEGQLVNENGYRYQGKNPNNYIWFNNELWRIIGVFDDTSHGIEGENLVKIIREEPISGLAWDADNINNWNESSLKKLLNNEYLNALNGNTSANCRGYSTTIPANCDYTVDGLQSGYRELIEEVTWYLGGFSTSYSIRQSVYIAERDGKVYSGRPFSGTGKIGLMYLSDYGYSVLSSSCAYTTDFSSYGKSSCAGSSWLYGKGYEWTITQYSSNANDVGYVSFYGNVGSADASSGHVVRPVLYLKSVVKILDGSGSYDDPFIIRGE